MRPKDVMFKTALFLIFCNEKYQKYQIVQFIHIQSVLDSCTIQEPEDKGKKKRNIRQRADSGAEDNTMDTEQTNKVPLSEDLGPSRKSWLKVYEYPPYSFRNSFYT